MTKASPVAASPEDVGIAVLAYPPAWRGTAIALEVCSRGSVLLLLAWTLGFLPFLGDPPVNTLKQIRLLGTLFAAPEALSWCLRSAFAARLHVRDGLLVIARRDVCIEVPLASVERLEAWTLPLPRQGVFVRLASGKILASLLQVADPLALADAMVAGGASPTIRAGLEGPSAVFARARAVAGHSRLDHPFLKFVVYSLVPAVPVFRLHQFITFGGTFGEYYTFGLKAYLLGFGLWWISFAMGLLMFATAVRAAVEGSCLLVAAVAPKHAAATRRALEVLQRVAYYVGMPAWLAIRLLA